MVIGPALTAAGLVAGHVAISHAPIVLLVVQHAPVAKTTALADPPLPVGIASKLWTLTYPLSVDTAPSGPPLSSPPHAVATRSRYAYRMTRLYAMHQSRHLAVIDCAPRLSQVTRVTS